MHASRNQPKITSYKRSKLEGPAGNRQQPTSGFDMEVSWGHGRASSFGDAPARHPSLHSNLGQQNLGQNLGQDRQALGSNCSPPDLSKRFLTAWEEARWEEQKLLGNPHFTQLRAEVDRMKDCIGHLVKLLDSLYKESPMQYPKQVGKQACIDKLERQDGATSKPHKR